MAVLEIALPTLKKDRELVEAGMKKLGPIIKAKLHEAGVLNCLRGFFATEDGRDISGDFREVLLLQWPTAQHFRDFISSPGFLEFKTQLEPFAAAPPELKPFAVAPPPLKLFEDAEGDVPSLFGVPGDAVLEYLVIRPRDPSEAGAQGVLQQLRSGLAHLGARGAALGTTSNLATREIGLVSLYASDAELETARASAARQQLLAAVAGAADVTSLVAHVEKMLPLSEV
ncbi:hypothetical protein F4802DRAFT_602389 [Xylaria palmicola]|nr:hypothetical protein F4802DRAFT_602389 [Xylaria palmicola]